MKAKPSSSTSELFGGTYARGAVADAVSDSAWVQAMLDAEAALGGPQRSAGEIDIAQLGRDGAEHASPVVPLAKLFPGTHTGATSQDILDTAMMLVAQRARTLIAADAGAAAQAAAVLARRHRDDPFMGVTLAQPALPTSFGLKAAGWMTAIDESLAALDAVELAVQMGGPVGQRDPQVAAQTAAALGLHQPLLAWHTDRMRPAQLACALGLICGTLGKLARDVTLSTYLREGDPDPSNPRGGSSAMAHKRNPVAAISILACSRRTPGLVSTMLSCMESEHERAAGAWQAEWGTLTELLRLTGSAAAWARDLLENLEVDVAAMRSQLPGGEVDLGAAAELVDRALQAGSR